MPDNPPADGLPGSPRLGRARRGVPATAEDHERAAARQERASLRTMLVTLAPAVLTFPAARADTGFAATAWLSAGLAVLAAWKLTPWGAWARRLATLAVVLPTGLWIVTTADRPTASLLLVVVASMLVLRCHPDPALLRYEELEDPGRTIRGAAWLALALGIGAWFRPWAGDLAGATALVAASVMPSVFALYRPTEHPRGHRVARLGVWLGLAFGVLHLALDSDAILRALPAVPASMLLAGADPRDRDERDAMLAGFLGHPPRLLVASFGALCALGTLLLALPAASRGGSLRTIDALFTAVSAACVTGLSVVDISTALTPFGQAIVLLLIQAGGLGIMTFAAAAFVLFGRRLGVKEEGTAVGLLGATDRSDVQAALRRVLIVTAVSEALGSVALTLQFRALGDGWAMAAWRGLFTAISAFCNAGFALQSDSLIGYRQEPMLLLTVAALIVAGGLGPAVIVAVPHWWRTGRTTLHTRLVVVVTAVMIAWPFVAWTAFEWNHALADLPAPDRLANALFQSITLRTAGFNSVDITALQPATWTIMLAAMFVGGSPGSTAGGVKTTTVAVVFLEIASTIGSRRQVRAFARRLPTSVVREAIAVVGVGALGALGLLIALQLTQRMPLDVAFFEAMSALATVGLSIGGTAMLDDVGKVMVLVAMFAGRVGPLTLLLFLQDEEDPLQDPRMPQEAVPVG